LIITVLKIIIALKIGYNATLLGPIHAGNNVKIGAETVIINHNVPDNCTVVGAPGHIVKLNGIKTEKTRKNRVLLKIIPDILCYIHFINSHP